MKKLSNDLILRVLSGKPTERTPIWLMRQAGRFLPQYMAVRAKYDFLTICRTPEIAAEVTIQPVDVVGVDAAIIFSDILVLPEAMGMELIVEEGGGGPRFTNPVKDKAAASAVHDADCENSLGYVANAIRITVGRLGGRVPLIGFCGSPWTLLAYMVEGKGGDFSRARAFLHEEPAMAHRLLDMITRNAVSYLKMQHEAGVDVVQIFDSWAGFLSVELYKEFSIRYIGQIVEALTPDLPVIVFAKGANHSLEALAESMPSAIGVDWTIPINEASARIGVVVQGNLDPAVLLARSEIVEHEARKILESAPRGKHIFNLGHGILQNTPVESVKALVHFVKTWKHG